MRLMSNAPVLRRWMLSSLVAVSMLSLIALNLPLTLAGGTTSRSINLIGSDPGWALYTDERFGFKIDYPTNWFVLPRDDSPDRVSAVLTFSDRPEPNPHSDTSADGRIVVSVGFYLAEIQTDQSLSEWIDLYEQRSSVFAPSQIQAVERKPMLISGRQGLLRQGISPLGDFQVANVRDGHIVWFIWGNADAQTLSIYNHMVASFVLGRTSPQALEQVYGSNFQPMILDNNTPESLADVQDEVTVRNTGTAKSLKALRLQQDPAGWRLPFSNQRTITAGPGCIATHQGTASGEAIDYSMPAGTAVKATYNGIVSFFGWNDQGYGNLITLDHGPSPTKRSYYAHLQSFGVFYVGESISTGTTIGWADSTGDSTGNHLHFEARRLDNNSGVWVRTLTTTTWRSGDANNPCWGTEEDWDGTATGP